MYSEFAYSTQMQIILVFVTYAKTFLSTYLIANIILAAFDVSANWRQKMVFSFITGSILQNTFVYVVYFLGGMYAYNLVYFLVVHPNPITALLYYYTARVVFKLPPERSAKLMSYVYVFWITSIAINRLIGALFFAQDVARYNYLLDAAHQIATLALFAFICASIQYFLRRSQASLKFSENMFFDEKKELFFYFMKAVFVYTVSAGTRIVLADQIVANIIITLVLLLFIVISVFVDIIRYNKKTISNRDAHISALFKSIEELRGIKHDFNNILHTYSGYLELGEYERLKRYHASLVLATSHAGSTMELAQKMQENPAVITLLIDKLEYADRMNVRLILSLKCAVDDLFIDNLDISRAMSHLLDCAIDTASASEQRKVYVTIESKSPRFKIIIITASSPKDGQAYVGANAKRDRLASARGILSKYGNCTFQVKRYDYELSFYIELKERPRV